MKNPLPTALAVFLLACGPAHAAGTAVTIEVAQPGVYGRIDIGRLPPPAVVLPQPVVIEQPPVVVRPEPVYLWVPGEHRKHWRKHCRKYGACAVPVYFVRHHWYDEHVRHALPAYGGHNHDDDDGDDGYGRHGAKPRYRGGEYKEKYRDGNCRVEREWKRDGSYKEERECRQMAGRPHGGEFEEKYVDGACRVEREFKRDGTYKEKLDCRS
jgi:hypothetical protein